ncbi:hypothetical protein Q2T40_14565 [Winogradskyella maritima]|uniref:Uncharacterized protein n=1 Tax=Winogradskyella maritima TaxID=1517766 RepID=A0ABV8AG10_9FLAO|nr:hypothetical protein [Winogradskyella maritima]
MKTIFKTLFLLLGVFIFINSTYAPAELPDEEILVYDGFEGDMYFFTDANDEPVIIKRNSTDKLFKDADTSEELIDAKFKTQFDSRVGYRPNRIYTVKEVMNINRILRE